MEKKNLALWLFLLAILTGQCSAEAVVGNFRLISPSALLVSTDNFTLFWESSEPVTSTIQCGGPGFTLAPKQVETEAALTHSIFMVANFSGEGELGCDIDSFPINGSPVRSNYSTKVNCEGVRLELDKQSVQAAVYFNRPRGTGPYYVNATVKVRNACAGRAEVSVSPSSPPSGIGMKVDRFTLFGLDSYNALVMLTVPDSALDGQYFGRVSFSSKGSTVSEAVNVTVHWPGPKLDVIGKDIGNAKSGVSSAFYVEVKETLGYRVLQNVSCSAVFQDELQKPQNYSVGAVQPFGSGKCKFTIELPGRGAKVGNYSAYVRINSAAGERAVTVNYTVPVPYMLLVPKELSLGKVTFDAGKDVAHSLLIVMENGGFTPLEDIRFRLISGENEWVTPPDCTYAPPGGRANCTFSVSISDNASIGAKEWVFGVSSKATPEIMLVARAEVYFIGIEDALIELEKTRDYSIMAEFMQAETLKADAEAMLNGMRGGNESIAETATAMSLHGGVVSLLSQMEEANLHFSKGNSLEAGRNLLGAKMSLERISSSYRLAKVKDAALLGKMGAMYLASVDFWNASSPAMLSAITEDARASETKNESRNYMKAAEYYSILEQIYSQDNGTSANFGMKAAEMERMYSDSIEKAGELKASAKRLLLLARGETTQVGQSHLILNPLSYRRVVDNYRFALEDYEATLGLYRVSGQQNELNLILSEMGAVESEYQFVDVAFKVGSVGISILLIIGMMRISVGMQRYREDEEDMETGDVMVR